MNPTLFALVVAAAIFIGLLATATAVILASSSQADRRLQRRLEGHDRLPETDEVGGGTNALIGGIARQGRAIEKMVDAKGETSKLLIQAGWRDVGARLGYYVFQGSLPIVLLLILACGALFTDNKFFHLPLLLPVGFAALALALLVPRIVLRRIADARRTTLSREVPLFVHLLVLLFEAGLSTRQALASLVRDGTDVLPELQKELDLVLRQLDAGGEIAQILGDLSKQLEVEDLGTIFSVLRQVDRYGGEVREPLLETLKVIEERRGLDIRERVNLMSGRMTVVMVLFFFPALLIFTAGPAFMAIISALGHAVRK